MRTHSRRFALAMLIAMLAQVSSPYFYLVSHAVYAESLDETSSNTSVEAESATVESTSSSSEKIPEQSASSSESNSTETKLSATVTSDSTTSSSSSSAGEESDEEVVSSSTSSATAGSSSTSSSGSVGGSYYDQEAKEFKVAPVELGVTYTFPGNKYVTIRFTKLPEVAGDLKIKELSLTSKQRDQLNSVGSKAYEFTSSMTNGTFAYEITLPKGKAKDAVIKYADSLSGLPKGKEAEVEVENNVVSFTADHFTVFVVTDDQATTSGGSWDDYAGQGSSFDASNGVHYPFFTTPTGDITWAFSGLGAANYDVFISWSTHPNRTQTAEYTVNYVGGSQTFTVNQELLADQTTTGGSGEFSGWYRLNGPLAGGQFQMDATSTVVLPTKDNTSGTEYVIGDEVVLVNTVDNGSFVGTERYVRENNASDVAAQVHVNTLVEDVRFYLDGVGPVAGAYINAVSASEDRWRLITPIAAGDYTVTAEVKIAGTWYAFAGSSTVYSLDLPSFEYVSPSSDPQFFRTTDNPVRIKHDDEYNQFESISLRVYDYSTGSVGALLFTYTVNRAECDLTQAGNYVLCDINDSASWANLAEGRYLVDAQSDTYANNGVRYTHTNSDSLPFYVDGTAPVVNSFNITTVLTSPYTVYSNQIAVTANATDTAPGEVKHVEFYMRTPRASDGVCVDAASAGAIIKLNNNAKDGDDTYTNNFDTSDLNGDYCLFAKAEDLSTHHSAASSIKVKIDNVAPVVEITNPADNAYVSGTVAIRGSYTDVNPLRYYTVIRNSSNVNVAGPGTVNIAAGFTDQLLFNWNTTSVPDGTYTVRLEARDAAGNRDNAAGSQDIHTVIVDNTDPVITDMKMFVDGVETTWVKAGQTVVWKYTLTEVNGIDKAASDIASGNIADRVAKEITSGGLADCTNTAANTYECEYSFVMPSQYGDATDITTPVDDQVTGGTIADLAGNTVAITDLKYTYYEPASVTFIKNVIDEAGNDITDGEATAFDINLDGVGQKDFGEGLDAKFDNLLPGNYNFNEIIDASFASKYNFVKCEIGAVDAAGVIALDSGDDVTVNCTNELVELPDVEVSPVTVSVVENKDLLLTALVIDSGTQTHSLEWKCTRQSDGATVQGITTGTTKTVNFSNTGTFKCTVTITDGNGDTDSATATITVTSAEVDLDPEVVLYGTSPATNNGQINVSAGASFRVIASLTQTGNANYTYQFGGACAGNTTTSSTNFASNNLSLNAGTYTCNVTVTDKDGDTDTASVTINVTGSAGGGVGDEGEPDDEGSVQGETDNNGEIPTTPTETPTNNNNGQTCTSTVTVYGYIYVDVNNDSVVNASDTRLGGLQINIFDSNNTLVTTATTDSTGYWEKQICPGSYRFELANVNLPSNAQVLGASSRNETITGNDQVDFVFAANSNANQAVDLSNYLLWLLGLLVLIFAGGLYAFMRNNQKNNQY